MKRFFLSFLLLPTLLFAQSNGFVLSGTISGLPEGSEVKITSTQDNSLLTQGTIKGGVFNVKGTVPEPGLYWITIANEQAQHIYLENTAIKVSGTKNDLKNLKIEGSESHADFNEFRTIFNPLVGELNAAVAQVNEAKDEAERLNLIKKYDSVNKLVRTEVGKFVAAKKSSFVTPFLLFITAELIDDPMLLEERFNMLDATVRTSNIGKSLQGFIAESKIGAVGTQAMDFTQNDVAGKPVSLSSFRGKYVLVDFWASWCKPCREDNPNVVKAYNKFNKKNFTILGVSLDQEKEPWIKAIEKDGLKWTQVSDLKYWNNSVAQLYRVNGIPFNYLIDPNGKIVGRNLHGEALDAKLCELLGCN
ncbi:MAG TPA: TlpA disulfide reductase family protein [Chitinophagaceae bacterium]|nr:TlpA disulfide reductase family protein [Chitinophagaceae bacterium]